MGASRRSRIVATVAGAVLVLAAMSAAVAAPAPVYSATLTHDGACTLSSSATWKNARVAKVFANWYLDAAPPQQSLITQEAPPPRLRGSSVSFVTGPFAPTAEGHTWLVLYTFYSKEGVNLGQVLSNSITVSCAVAG